jgi:hypothetical protein
VLVHRQDRFEWFLDQMWVQSATGSAAR